MIPSLTTLGALTLGLLAGASVAIPLILLNIRYASKLGFIDWPKARGVAEEQIPIIGYAVVTLGVLALIPATFYFQYRPWVFVTALIVGLMGAFDDRRGLSAVDKLLLQIMCVMAVVHWDPVVRDNLIARYGNWGAFWAIFFVIGLTNAVNFVDGIDGLAGVVLFLGGLGYIILSHVNPDGGFDLANATTIAAQMGLLIPFLYFNVMRRKGFLGNVGSYFFSYTFALFHLSINIPAQLAVSRMSLSALCFLVPIADSLLVISTRIISLRSPFQPDKGHLHHRLIQSSLPLRQVLLNFAFIEVTALCVATVMAYHLPSLQTPLPFLLCISHAVMAAVLIFLVEKASRRRIQLYFQRMDEGQPIFFMKYAITSTDGKPISPSLLRKLEALISAEIRVTDLCFSEGPSTLVISMKSQPDAVSGIDNRVDRIFKRFRVHAALMVEEGEFVKISRTRPVKKLA